MTIIAEIRERISTYSQQEIFTARDFLDLGSRTAVDQSLCRLVKMGELLRIKTGVYVPVTASAKFPHNDPTQLAGMLARYNGAKIDVGGSKAAAILGLASEDPSEATFVTDGLHSKFKIGTMTVFLKPIAARKLRHAGTKAGLAISALWYLGKHKANRDVIEKIRSELSAYEFSQLKAACACLPSWASDLLRKFD